MSWEIVAIWAIVAGTIIWFVRDERLKRRSNHGSSLAAGVDMRRITDRPVYAPATPQLDKASVDTARRMFMNSMRKDND